MEHGQTAMLMAVFQRFGSFSYPHPLSAGVEWVRFLLPTLLFRCMLQCDPTSIHCIMPSIARSLSSHKYELVAFENMWRQIRLLRSSSLSESAVVSTSFHSAGVSMFGADTNYKMDTRYNWLWTERGHCRVSRSFNNAVSSSSAAVFSILSVQS